jgi:hypothetical protein
VWYLAADYSKRCYDDTHWAFQRAGIFWAIFYLIGESPLLASRSSEQLRL